jgi:hypothetical protein
VEGVRYHVRFTPRKTNQEILKANTNGLKLAFVVSGAVGVPEFGLLLDACKLGDTDWF